MRGPNDLGFKRVRLGLPQTTRGRAGIGIARDIDRRRGNHHDFAVRRQIGHQTPALVRRQRLQTGYDQVSIFDDVALTF